MSESRLDDGQGAARPRAPGWARRKMIDWSPWRDRAGRFSALRAAAFALVAIPGLWLALALGGVFGELALGSEPLHMAEHLTGLWALRFLVGSLAISPLRRLTGWSRLIQVRRMIGLAAFAYAAAHFGLFVLEQQLSVVRVFSEIVQRLYLTIGFAALLGLCALAATSFDRAIRAMGRNWRRLHKLAYPIAVLGLAHYALQEKFDVSAPTFLFGVFAALMLHRVVTRPAAWPEARILIVAALAALISVGVETAWYAFATGAPWQRVLEANLDLSAWRPGQSVLAACCLPLPFAIWRRVAGEPGPAPRRA